MTALEYIQELYQHWTPGTASWLDGHNNKAFLSGEVGYTNNGISIYAAAVREGMDIADDMDHAYYPIGPAGKPTELQLPFPIEIFGYTEYPNAAKALLAFLMDKQQYDAWLQESVGYFTQTLKGFSDHPVWGEDPKRKVFADASERTLDFGHAGAWATRRRSATPTSSSSIMVAEAATGQATPKEAAARAEKRANRYYRV